VERIVWRDHVQRFAAVVRMGVSSGVLLMRGVNSSKWLGIITSQIGSPSWDIDEF